MKFACFSAGVITVALSLLINGASAKLPPGVAGRARQLKEKKRANKEFMNAMNGNKRILEAKNKAQAARRDRMYEKLLSSARKLDQYEEGDDEEQDSEYANDYWNDYEVVDPGFDLSNFAFKYAGCAAIKEYSMDSAAETGKAMISATYAVFRLCPADSCNKYSVTGCGKNYGEYIVEMETYLEAMMTYYDDRYEQYCMYCLPCDDYAKEDYAAWLQDCYYEKNEAEYMSEQDAAAYAYNEYSSMNNGDMSGYNAANYDPDVDYENYQYSSYANDEGDADNNANRKMADENENENDNDNYAEEYSQGEKYYQYDEDGDNAVYYNWNAANYNWRASQKYGYNNGNDGNDGNDGNGDGGDDEDAENAYAQMYNLRTEYYQDYVNNNNQYDEEGQYNEDGQTSSSSSSAQYGNYNAYQNNFNSANNNNNYKGNQNQKFYGYYDSQGQWVQPDDEDAKAAGWGYWLNGVWYPYGQDDYEAEQDECFLEFAEFDQCDEYVCGDYVKYCTDWYGDAETQRASTFSLGAYTQCTAFQGADGKLYYIAPHCGSNHFTIKLGIYSDNQCVDYIGDTVSISTVLGYQTQDSDLNYFPKECISCDGAESYAVADEEEEDAAEEEEEEEDEEEEDAENQSTSSYSTGYYGNKYQDYQEPNVNTDGVVAFCSAMYSSSATCNVNMNSYSEMSEYMSEAEIRQETRNCAFIDNIVYGTYDQQGDIQLTSPTFDFSDWKNPEQYRKVQLPASQAIGLALSVLLVVCLSATAIFMNRSLHRRDMPWRPRRFGRTLDNDSLSRKQSGITMGRSRSGPGSTPLI